MSYDPTNHRPTKPQTEYDDREIPSGVYLFGPAWLICPSMNSWKTRNDVLMGPFAGCRAFVLQGRDTNKEGTRNRLYYFTQSANIKATLETTEDGRITERSLRNDVLGHAFKAKITKKKTRKHRNGEEVEYTNYDFQMFHPRSEWSKAEFDIAAKWETEFAERRQAEGYDPHDQGSSYGGNGGGGSRSHGPPPDDGAPMPDGDEGGWGNDGWG